MAATIFTIALLVTTPTTGTATNNITTTTTLATTTSSQATTTTTSTATVDNTAIPATTTTNASATTTAAYDAEGAMKFTVAVVLVFGVGVIGLLGIYHRRSIDEDLSDKEAYEFIKGLERSRYRLDKQYRKTVMLDLVGSLLANTVRPGASEQGQRQSLRRTTSAPSFQVRSMVTDQGRVARGHGQGQVKRLRGYRQVQQQFKDMNGSAVAKGFCEDTYQSVDQQGEDEQSVSCPFSESRRNPQTGNAQIAMTPINTRAQRLNNRHRTYKAVSEASARRPGGNSLGLSSGRGSFRRGSTQPEACSGDTSPRVGSGSRDHRHFRPRRSLPCAVHTEDEFNMDKGLPASSNTIPAELNLQDERSCHKQQAKDSRENKQNIATSADVSDVASHWSARDPDDWRPTDSVSSDKDPSNAPGDGKVVFYL